MLVLRRRIDEAVVLRRRGDEAVVLEGEITISVLAIEGSRVKIGINAPSGVSIVREELLRGGVPNAVLS